MSNTESYKPHDKSFLINANDADITPIRISLPEPPPIETIDGYGLSNEEQYFRRMKLPDKLKELERRVYREIEAANSTNHNKSVNGYTITKRFWNEIYDNVDDYKEELKYINDFWWYRLNGYWFFNDGKPTYISGRYFDFLNTWYMPDVSANEGYPEYRDKDRRKYLFMQYLYEGGQTFKHIDSESGKPKKVGDKYRMTDLHKRLFFGTVEPKCRRSGATQQGLHNIFYEITIMVKGGFGTIVSMDGDNAKVHYKKKFLPFWKNLPLCFKPVWSGNSISKSIEFALPKNVYGKYEIGGIINITESASETKNDGDKIHAMLADEGGKAKNVNVMERHNVNKLAMSTAHGSKINGWCTNPSTVEDITQYGKDYQMLCDGSNFYKRKPDGQTTTGLALVFFPAFDGMEGFIDRFGMSVIDKPTERQKRLRPDAEFALYNMGAKDKIQGTRDSLLRAAKTNPDAIINYRSEVRKNPIKYAECWLGESGSTGMPIEKIEKRLAQIRRERESGTHGTVRGKFIELKNTVRFIEDKTGHWVVSLILDDKLSNLSRLEPIFDSQRKMNTRHNAPLDKFKVVIGVDPYTQINRAEAKSYGRNNRLSNGGIAVFLRMDKSEAKKDIDDMNSFRFIATLNTRFELVDEFYNEVLKVARYYGGMVYPERNKDGVEKYFMNKQYGGYLLYGLDRHGKKKDDAGDYTNNKLKKDIFLCHKDYLEMKSHIEHHEEYLVECKEIGGIEQMTHFDLFTAGGFALLGDKVLEQYDSTRYLSSMSSGRNRKVIVGL